MPHSSLLTTRVIDLTSEERWLHEIRRIEFDRAMELVPLGRAATVLELGSGDGFQHDLLRQRFDLVFAIDPEHRPFHADRFAFSVAETLPFPDAAFDFVFSSNVVEHLADRARAIAEAVRVLRPGGYMAHTVPIRFWKAANLLLHPVAYPACGAARWRARGETYDGTSESQPTTFQPRQRPGILTVLRRWICPAIHGSYSSHLNEFQMYGRSHWLNVFAHPRLVVVAGAPLLSYSPYGLLRFRLLGFRKWLARHGLSSTHAFILRKIN